MSCLVNMQGKSLRNAPEGNIPRANRKEFEGPNRRYQTRCRWRKQGKDVYPKGSRDWSKMRKWRK